MRILLIGEYSNLHATLASALRQLGHEVLVVSNGDNWKNYQRDIDLRRYHAGPLGSISVCIRLLKALHKMKGFDVVQVINPIFVDLKPRWNKMLFDYLKKHNYSISLGVFGDDTVIINNSLNNDILQYTDLCINGTAIEGNDERINCWNSPERKDMCHHAASNSNCLIACLYEYYKLYASTDYKSRLRYIALPINTEDQVPHVRHHDRVKILIGVQKGRTQWKGTDKMLPLFHRLAENHNDKVELIEVKNIPFAEYKELLKNVDVLVDQLYSYTPAMNALEAMKNGVVVVSGGEDDYYRFIGEGSLRPIINLQPCQDEQNYKLLEDTILDDNRLAQMSADSIAFVAKYHDAYLVAEQYLQIWSSL